MVLLLFLGLLLSLYDVILLIVLEAKVKYRAKADDKEETQKEKVAVDDERQNSGSQRICINTTTKRLIESNVTVLYFWSIDKGVSVNQPASFRYEDPHAVEEFQLDLHDCGLLGSPPNCNQDKVAEHVEPLDAHVN